jgi:hypothetical protein
MENNNNGCTISLGGGFAGTLTIAFIVLKLVGVINWSWIWILSPLWISFILGLVILIIIVAAYALIR